jgi:hypothetical protein
MTHFGFIITRHVNSKSTNRYWNQCVKLIRATYPFRKIIIIDDNSDQSFIKADFAYNNLQIIQSEYPGRGELLPYIYYLRHKWFPSAVIIHDSLFIHKKIRFEKFKHPVMPLWHHKYDKENITNIVRIASALSNNSILLNKLVGTSADFLSFNKDSNFNLCFGAQSFIKLNFLELLQNKYNINNLVNVISNRSDRCSLERVLGLLFCEEYPILTVINSLFGDIITKHRSFSYKYDEYLHDFKRKKILYPFVKVWSGR